ncbi:hypothetical protein PRIC1_002099 [Phytophthora ramorum]|uniref:Cell 12A endoglucanase n=1 Tax=Phytophthora ramorum TaxID=164328 RepID=Q30BY2_PHYRM|nr:cell 12A endoglucanase [Phytophthora ramorum]KAH7509786.1 Inactive glycoside hydrolase XLP1 [Phytophthora ramorum]
MKASFAAALAAAAMSAANAADFCDQWGQTTSGDYIIYNNMWGKADATTAKQCTGLTSGSGDTISWHTNWSYQGGEAKVKSYPNAALEFDPVPLTSVKSIPSTMQYTVKYSGTVVADVAYDLFTSSTADGEKEFEIMIWLAAIGGAGPISSTGKPIDTTTIAGNEWSVYSGPNGQMMVYSFVAPKQVENFEGDLMEFFNYLAKSQSFKTSQFLIKVECGTEPFLGDDVTLTVSKYSAVVNTGGASGTTGSSTGSSTTAQSSDSSSSTQTTTAPSTSSTGSSAETPSTGSSSEQTPSTSSTGSSAETPSSGSSTGSSSEQTPATSGTGSSAETPSTGSSSEQTPATSSTGSSEEAPASSSGETTTSSSGDETTTSASSDVSTPSMTTAPSTSSTSSSSEETPSTSSTGSFTGQAESTTAPSTPASGLKCTTRRVRRE